jgi:hypothetical protein
MPKSKHRNKKLRKPKIVKYKIDDGIINVPANPSPLLEIQRPASNSKMEFTFIRGFPQTHPESKKVRALAGSESVYKVTYVLSVPGLNVFREKLDFKNFSKFGETLLQFPVGETIVIYMTDEKNQTHEIWFEGNAKGLLSKVIMRLKCNDFETTERIAHECISTVLSYWSFLFDIGIEISGYEILEENTGSLKFSVGLVGQVKGFTNEEPFRLLPEYRRIFAAYREAMNSSNLFYQILCFFKVTEGIISLRQKRIKSIRPLRKGEQGFESDEKFPNVLESIEAEDEITKTAFIKYLGKNFQDTRDELKEEFRHPIAHLIKFDSVIDADRYDDVIKCGRAIPVLKYISRQMLQNELKYINEINV